MPELEASFPLMLRAFDEKARAADFVASTEAVDSYGEIVEQTWRLGRFERNPVVLYAHNSRELPIGRAEKVAVVDGRLECRVVFATKDANPLAEQVFQLVREKVLRAVSVGFVPGEVRREKRDGDDVYVLGDNDLYEVSVVPIPANPEALAKMRARARQEASMPSTTPNKPAPSMPPPPVSPASAPPPKPKAPPPPAAAEAAGEGLARLVFGDDYLPPRAAAAPAHVRAEEAGQGLAALIDAAADDRDREGLDLAALIDRMPEVA